MLERFAGQKSVLLGGVLPGSVLHEVSAGKSVREICTAEKCITGRCIALGSVLLGSVFLGGVLPGSALQKVHCTEEHQREL